ncbi:electron transport complex subunit RsxD [Alkalilimnicola sp. S0819]|uniref:electron transport complex subunit RsxD n=1 Tax=Alkalilimnicola sp. S0819 TaxID=2613922 RepID=UPI001262201B|nr:electron transport complex subunit RsxD [Alkalilimnicola sp. S0819]KAB7623198.1 electron transport complex subunit RsxD [Alkalilimnicola sp. S0819]MPQ17044.1 electron transport complex subunit RsxD [Alkalilimnicola sp. S0819]
MRFFSVSSPHLPPINSVPLMMRRVLYALLPGTALMALFFGYGVLLNLLLAIIAAVAGEALMLVLRRRPVGLFLGDYSALVTAALLALALPPLAPWWLTVLGTLFAIVLGKHLYGGLGYNPFNPAMVGYVILLISFPREMTLWPAPAPLLAEPLGLAEIWRGVFGGGITATGRSLDALSMATPLDHVGIELGLERPLGAIKQDAVFGVLGGVGWLWINLAFLAGGLWLVYKKVIAWQIPTGMLGSLGALAALGWALAPDTQPGVLFHVLSGGIMLGAFFIATDPVSAATTPRGRLIYGAGIGALIFIIRSWGGYPDGIAFGVLLMNMAAPLIDYYNKPRVYGH